MLNISIYGEHTITVESITRLLQDEPSFKIQKTPSQDDFIKQDIIVYCASSYSNTLFKQIKLLHQETPNIKKVLVISMAHKHFLNKLFQAGISSIVSYKSSPDDLTQAIKYASLDQQYICPDLSQMVINTNYPSIFNDLSSRELEITYLLANGMNVKNVSSELDISPKTVNTYRYRIFNKLSIDRNVDLFRMVSQEAAYMLCK